MSAHQTINTRGELERLLTRRSGREHPKSVNERICRICGEKIYRRFFKGQEQWLGCKCSKIRVAKQ